MLECPEESYALLVGTSFYEDPALPNLPSIEHNLTDLARLLSDDQVVGLPSDHIVILHNPLNDGEVGSILNEYSQVATGSLLFYFGGHGVLDRRGRLFLAMSETRVSAPNYLSLATSDVLSELTDSSARVRILISDCCFSGRIFTDHMSDLDHMLVDQLQLDSREAAGAVTLASSARNVPSLAPKGARHTAFTGELIHILKEGIDSFQPALDLQTIFLQILASMRRRNLPQPRMLNRDTAGRVLFARNPAFRRSQQQEVASEQARESEFHNVLDALRESNPTGAFEHLRPFLYLDLANSDASRWTYAFELFARVCAGMGYHDLASKARTATGWGSARDIVSLGDALVDVGLLSIAANVYNRAHQKERDNPIVLKRLVNALFSDGRYADVQDLANSFAEVVAARFEMRYLSCLAATLVGDIGNARQLYANLQPSTPDEREQAGVVRRMLQRATVTEEFRALDDKDLRGWHFVLTGGLLLHLSEAGFEEGMHGRNAWVQDTPAQCLEGITKAAAVLSMFRQSPKQVLAFPDDHSQALASAAAQTLSCPLIALSPETLDEPGLVVAYDLGLCDPQLVESLATHRPDQILWTHAASWTDPTAYAADIVTFLYQQNNRPWDESLLRIVEGDKGPTIPEEYFAVPEEPSTPTPLDTAAASTEILSAHNAKAWDYDDLISMINQLFSLGKRHVGLMFSSGQREPFWYGGPVKSSRFF
jgi:hypothetical protein